MRARLVEAKTPDQDHQEDHDNTSLACKIIAENFMNMFKLWYRCLTMENGRLTKSVFLWDYENGRGWSNELKQILSQLEMDDVFTSKSVIDLNYAWSKITELACERWKIELRSKPKLLTYMLLKGDMNTEPYANYCYNRQTRSLLAQFRLGILPLHIETGRFKRLPVEERVCKNCESADVENEHFLCSCTLYAGIRQALYEKVSENMPHFINLVDAEKFKVMMQVYWRDVGKYIVTAWNMHQKNMYVN